jgi:hypothetical protein
MTIFRSDQRKQLQLGLNAIFGLQYNEWPELWRDIFTVENSEKAYEEEVMQSGLGAASVKPEGAGVEYDDMYETYVARYQHDTIAKAVAITEEAVEDNLYASVGQRIAKALARSMKYTKEMRAANVLNFGFDSNYSGGDGVQLFSTAHPLGGGGTLANTLVTPADLSESSLEEAAIQIADWVDERGIPVRAMIKKMIIPTSLQFVAARLLMTQYQPDTQSNNINALFKLGTIENGFSVNRYLTDPDSWFLKTDVDNGLKHFVRRPLKKGLEGDFETGNLRYKVSERYSQGWSDPRGAWASPGA